MIDRILYPTPDSFQCIPMFSDRTRGFKFRRLQSVIWGNAEFDYAVGGVMESTVLVVVAKVFSVCINLSHSIQEAVNNTPANNRQDGSSEDHGELMVYVQTPVLDGVKCLRFPTI